jgi:hypothetical protein
VFTASVIPLDGRIAAGIAEREAIPEKEKDYEETEKRGENDDSDHMVALHLRHSLKT